MGKFNSQVCTSIEQSKRLLELGLNPETADMHITNMSKKGISYIDNWQIGSTSYKEVMQFWYEKGLKLEDTFWEIIPAWSLHRLIEIAEVSVEVSGLFVRISSTYYYEEKDNVYDNLIDAIEELIKEEVFNKEYLKQ